jgi:serine/threonine protein kinase
MRSIETLDTRQHKSKSEVLLVKRAFITKKKHIEKHYNLGDKIGEGAYGGVKKGFHLKTKQEVAIKVIPKRNLDLESFRVEVESMRKLDHPHIIKLYEW